MIANLSYGMWIVIIGMQGWADSPTTTTIATVAAPINEAPFPSLAVCPAINQYHNAWGVTSIVFDFLDLINCGEDCDANAVQDFRNTFKQFTDMIVDQHFANPIDFEMKYENGTGKPGGFTLPLGYKGLEVVMQPFYVFYCELAQALELKNDTLLVEKLMNRLKDAIVSQEELTLDVLLAEEGITLKPEEATPFDFIFKKCEVSPEIMTFLGKLYFLDTKTLYQNIGTTFERLMEHGDLHIQSWSSSLVWDSNGRNIKTRVSLGILTT